MLFHFFGLLGSLVHEIGHVYDSPGDLLEVLRSHAEFCIKHPPSELLSPLASPSSRPEAWRQHPHRTQCASTGCLNINDIGDEPTGGTGKRCPPTKFVAKRQYDWN